MQADEFAAGTSRIGMLTQVLRTFLAGDLVGVGKNQIERSIFLEQLRGDFRTDQRHSRHVVDGVANGIACKRVDVRERRSVFNSRVRCAEAMQELLEAIASPVIVVSFNNEGYLSRDKLEAMLAGLWGGTGRVSTIENDFKRYVGAQIGIHNLAGEKVGRVSHLRNKEFVYVVTRGGSG